MWFRISKDVDFAHKIAGVLVESDGHPSKSTGFIPSKKQKLFYHLIVYRVMGCQGSSFTGFSPDEKFPQAAFAPYKNHNYEWNVDVSYLLWTPNYWCFRIKSYLLFL